MSNEFEEAIAVLVDAELLKDDSVVLEAERARDEFPRPRIDWD